MQENAVIKNIKKTPIHIQKNAEMKRTLLVHTQKMKISKQSFG